MAFWLLANPTHSLLHGTSVFLCFVYVCLKLSRDCFSQRNRLLFVSAVVACSFFLHGSFKILVSFISDARNHPDLTTWLANMELGDENVQRITAQSTLGQWVYSHLMCFALPFITFINIKSRLMRMPTLQLCAYVWLALGGAVSMAFPLFLLRYNTTMYNRTKLSPLRLPTWGMDVLGICLWISFWGTVSLPWSKQEEIPLYMLLLRWTLFLPSLVPATPVKNHEDHSMPFPLYCALAVLITGYHWYQSLKVIMGESLDFNLHHSQAAICDFALCFFSLVLYIFHYKRLGFTASLTFILVIPFLSLGSTFSLLVIYEVYHKKEQFSTSLKEELKNVKCKINWRQPGQGVRVPDLKSRGSGFKPSFDH